MISSRVVALAAAVLATAALWTLPLYEVSETGTVNGRRVTRQYRTRAADGSIFVVSSLPVLATLAVVYVKKLQTPVGVLMLLFALVAGMSIGLFYVPCALALLFPWWRGLFESG